MMSKQRKKRNKKHFEKMDRYKNGNKPYNKSEKFKNLKTRLYRMGF